MNGNRILAGTLSAVTLLFAGTAVAAEPGPHLPGTEGKMENRMDSKMSCDSMMGMMGGGTMGKDMMGGVMNDGQMMADLPPGNEKLNMQMQAEMMQAMGTILQKYADRISIPPEK